MDFCKGIVKDVVKQTIWFLACWFFKHDIWTCCETLWVYVIFVSIAAFFHSLFFLTVISFVAMDFQKFSRFFPVVRLSAFGDDKFLQNTFQFQIIGGGWGEGVRQITWISINGRGPNKKWGRAENCSLSEVATRYH